MEGKERAWRLKIQRSKETDGFFKAKAKIHFVAKDTDRAQRHTDLLQSGTGTFLVRVLELLPNFLLFSLPPLLPLLLLPILKMPPKRRTKKQAKKLPAKKLTRSMVANRNSAFRGMARAQQVSAAQAYALEKNMCHPKGKAKGIPINIPTDLFVHPSDYRLTVYPSIRASTAFAGKKQNLTIKNSS